MKKPLRLVTWLDSSTLNRGGWMRCDEIDPMPLCTIRSVGWVTRLDKRMLILSGCESDGGSNWSPYRYSTQVHSENGED